MDDDGKSVSYRGEPPASYDAGGTALQRYDRLIEALDALAVGFGIWDADDRLIACNFSYRALLGRVSGLVGTGQTMRELARVIYRNGEAPPEFMSEDAYIDYRIRQHHDVTQADEVHSDDDRCVRVTRNRLPNGDVVVTRVDVTDLRNTQAELEKKARALSVASDVLVQQALMDPLTGLPNRRAWDDGIAAIAEKARNSDRTLAILSIDLDGFKRVNDSIGHAAGDTVLAKVGARMKSILDDCEIIARVGGDEFLAAMIVDHDGEEAEEAARRLIETAARPVMFERTRCYFGVSIGIALSVDGDGDHGTLVSDADAALYHSKAISRNGYCRFTAEMRKAVGRQRRLAVDLVRAIEAREIQPFYQLKVAAGDHRPVGAEALARWHHPEFGLLGPFEFLDLAETLKLTAPIDRMILEQALESHAAWAEAGLFVPSLSVNVSAQRLRETDLLSGLQRLDIPHGSISFELVETAFPDQLDDQMRWNLDGLREMGIGIDLDDFGTGHASIAAMLNVRPTRVKIDRGLVNQLEEEDEKRQMVSLIISMAKTLDIVVVAEGVETAGQAALLADLDCDELQGYLFNKPVPCSEFQQIAKRCVADVETPARGAGGS